MKPEFVILAKQAVEMVNAGLKIQSGNRPGDESLPETLMVPLNRRKDELTSALYARRALMVEQLEGRILPLKARADAMRTQQIKIASAVDTLDSERRAAVLSVLPNIGRSLGTLQSEIGRLQREVDEMRDLQPVDDIAITAVASHETRTGNCDEMSSIAYFFLRDKGCRPLEVMTSRSKPDDDDQHQFVVIGRARTDKIGEPATWSDDAVVCDPWMREVYAPADLPAKLALHGYPQFGYSFRTRDE